MSIELFFHSLDHGCRVCILLLVLVDPRANGSSNTERCPSARKDARSSICGSDTHILRSDLFMESVRFL